MVLNLLFVAGVYFLGPQNDVRPLIVFWILRVVHSWEATLGYLGSSQDGRILDDQITSMFFSHEVRPYGRGPTKPTERGLINLGYEIYYLLTNLDDPPSMC